MSIFINADDTLINKYYNMLFKSNERIDACMLFTVWSNMIYSENLKYHSIHHNELFMILY